MTPQKGKKKIHWASDQKHNSQIWVFFFLSLLKLWTFWVFNPPIVDTCRATSFTLDISAFSSILLKFELCFFFIDIFNWTSFFCSFFFLKDEVHYMTDKNLQILTIFDLGPQNPSQLPWFRSKKHVVTIPVHLFFMEIMNLRQFFDSKHDIHPCGTLHTCGT